MSRTVRIGFVGTGGIAGHHLKQLREVEGAQIVFQLTELACAENDTGDDGLRNSRARAICATLALHSLAIARIFSTT